MTKLFWFILPERHPQFMGFLIIPHDIDRIGFNGLHFHNPSKYIKI